MKRKTVLPIRAACAAALVLVLAAAALMLFPGSVTMAFATGPDEVTYRTCSWFDDTVWGYGLFLVPPGRTAGRGVSLRPGGGLGQARRFPRHGLGLPYCRRGPVLHSAVAWSDLRRPQLAVHYHYIVPVGGGRAAVAGPPESKIA